MKKLEDFQAEKVNVKNVYGGKRSMVEIGDCVTIIGTHGQEPTVETDCDDTDS